MNILSFASNEVKEIIRNKRALIFMLLFPIALIFVLGNILTSAFDSDMTIGKIEVAYRIDSEGDIGDFLTTALNSVKSTDITVKKLDDKNKAIEAVKNKDIDVFINIDGKGINLYKNDRTLAAGDVVEGILKSIINKYSLAAQVMNLSGDSVEKIYKNRSDDYIKETSLNKERTPSAMDYYAVALTLMVGMYSAMSSVGTFSRENVRHTADRILASPARKYEVFIGKVIGNIASNYACVLIVFLVSKYLFGAYFGENVIAILGILLTEVMLFVAIGITIGYITKAPEASRGIVMIITQVFSFLGGAYFPADYSNKIIKIIADCIPLTWNINGVNSLIYANQISELIKACSINVILTLIFIIIASLFAKRKEGI